MAARAAHPAHRATIDSAADVLDELAVEIEALGATLCADETLIARFLTTLQAIDHIAQKQRAIAGLLRADCPISGLETISLEALRRQLHPGG